MQKQPALKPQDLLVVFALCAKPGVPGTYAALAARAGLSRSESHGSVARLEQAGLVRVAEGEFRVAAGPAREAVVSGAPWFFPAVHGVPTRGVPTAWGVPLVREQLQVGPDADVPVWPHPKGAARGPALVPLYPSVPEVALADSNLHELLALFDALRAGRARERTLARKLLLERLP